MKEIKEQGLRIPQDVALIGYTDELHSNYVEPALTAITHQTYEMGVASCNLLLQHLQKNQSPKKVVVPTRLIVRGSSVKSPFSKIEWILIFALILSSIYLKHRWIKTFRGERWGWDINQKVRTMLSLLPDSVSFVHFLLYKLIHSFFTSFSYILSCDVFHAVETLCSGAKNNVCNRRKQVVQ